MFDGLDLELTEGSAVGVRGANGTGKTTLLRVAATLLQPTEGTRTVLGWDDPAVPPPTIRRHIGYTGHAPALHPDLTLLQNLRYYTRLTGSDRSPAEVLAMVGLERLADRPARQASQGMLRRTDLARLLLTRPSLLLLDEPFSGLDSESAGIVDALIERTRSAGGAALLVSHDDHRLRNCDDILVLGRPTGSGTS